MKTTVIDLKDYMPDDDKRKAFADAVTKLLNDNKGVLVPVTVNDVVVAYILSAPPERLVLE